MKLGARRYAQTFVIAAVSRPILGADFFIENRVAIDLARRKLVECETGFTVDCGGPTSDLDPAVACLRVDTDADSARYEAILNEFPDLVTPRFDAPTVAHGVRHYIPTTGPPVFARLRRLPPDRLAAAKADFKVLLDNGTIRRSSSP